MNSGLFITGTDTGVGKTLVAAALLRALGSRGMRVCGMKPVAAGAHWRRGVLHNEDADTLRDAGNVAVQDELTCPYLLREAVSPHIAASLESRSIDLDALRRCFDAIAGQADAVVVEGAGGWYAPVNGSDTMASVAARLDLPVVLVVGLRLGCLNHAQLTARAIAADGLRLAGWIATEIEPALPHCDANVGYLRERLPAPLWARIPWLESRKIAQATDHLLGGAVDAAIAALVR